MRWAVVQLPRIVLGQPLEMRLHGPFLSEDEARQFVEELVTIKGVPREELMVVRFEER